ncbi:MAG: hypothetical protein JSR76_08010 [Verrucomicrobia bacterium]|nr:hypothetical protein [Verrucomicrobiota bacterium]
MFVKWILLLSIWQSLSASSLREEFQKTGYVEICNKTHGRETFESLYLHFDDLIDFLQKNPMWAEKLQMAKERFIRSKSRDFYGTDFFGFYDEPERSQISFYYASHFHEFIFLHYKQLQEIPEIKRFFEACLAIETAYRDLFNDTAANLGLDEIFSSTYSYPPILLKVIKYLPTYSALRPHYDGTAFSLFLDSTDNASLLLSPYKSSFTTEDFSSPTRAFSREEEQNSNLLIPGTLLKEFAIYPTPHIVTQSGNIRYATIAFGMRPNYSHQKTTFTPLPYFND